MEAKQYYQSLVDLAEGLSREESGLILKVDMCHDLLGREFQKVQKSEKLKGLIRFDFENVSVDFTLKGKAVLAMIKAWEEDNGS